MEHVAIDLGSKESQICVRGCGGEILEERRVATRSLGKYLAGRPKSRVVVEACAEAFPTADAAIAVGHEVVVVPASLAPSLGVGSRGVKSDVRDARNLSETSCRMTKLPQVHIPSKESREKKAICGLRDVLVETRTKLLNSIRGWARAQGLGVIRSGAPTTFAHRVREHLAKLKIDESAHVKRVLVAIEQLCVQIAEADQDVEKRARENATCQLLMTAPGIGPKTAMWYSAAIDKVERFSDAHRVASYLGMTPGENSSCTRQRRTGITKAGAPKVRWSLTQAAHSARRYYKDHPVVMWSFEVEKRRGKKIAILALARRLAAILFGMWRKGRRYEKDYQVTRAALVSG